MYDNIERLNQSPWVRKRGYFSRVTGDSNRPTATGQLEIMFLTPLDGHDVRLGNMVRLSERLRQSGTKGGGLIKRCVGLHGFVGDRRLDGLGNSKVDV